MDGDVRIQLAEDGADAQRLDLLTGYLREELLQLDVDDVTALRAGQAPPGTRAFDVVAVGSLLITLGRSAAGLRSVVSAVRRWRGRADGIRRSVRIEIDGDVLELSDATTDQQDNLIRLFLDRHAPVDG